jgi:hypothetical protein
VPYALHHRLTLAGGLGAAQGSTERWSFRLNLSRPPSAEALADIGADMSADAKLWVGAEAGICGLATLDSVKLARINELGQYSEDAFIDEFAPIPFFGPLAFEFPFQVALVVSLDTGQRGPSRRGRVYLPAPVVTLENDGQFQAAQALAIRDRFGAFLNNLNNAGGVDAGAPRVTIASIKGFNTDVTSCRVGRVLDTQRRRRRSLPEDYSAPLAVG